MSAIAAGRALYAIVRVADDVLAVQSQRSIIGVSRKRVKVPMVTR